MFSPVFLQGGLPAFAPAHLDRSIATNIMATMQFRQQLEAEFARDLVTHHATLSQILRGRRPLSARMVALFGRRLGL